MTLEELGRRAVACKHWRWMPGMYAEPLAFRVVWADDDSIGEADQISYLRERVPHIYPDLSDPATLGCLLALVREAWGDDVTPMRIVSASDQKRRWWYIGLGEHVIGGMSRGLSLEAESESELLVAALEAAP